MYLIYRAHAITKRLTDIFLALAGIILLLPFFPLIAIAIKLDSRGPVLYFADRVGKDMKKFKMYKFRTMMDTPLAVGESLSPAKDPRVTCLGGFLRRTKINELPQLINILKGEMTFVGPRPEAPDLAELYPEKAQEIFSVKPGLVGPGTILGRNEEELYPPGVDAKKYYLEKILPKKIEVDLEYLKNPSLFKDFQYILIGVMETLLGALGKRHIHNNLSAIYLLLADALLTLCSYVLAIVIYSKYFMGGARLTSIPVILPIAPVIILCWNFYFGMYSSIVKYMSYNETWKVLKGVTYGSLLVVILVWAFGFGAHWIIIPIMTWPILFLSLSGLRIGLKLYWEKKSSTTKTLEKRRILIFGAGDAGSSAYNTLLSDKNNPFEVAGFIDDAPDKHGKRLHGVKVLGNRYHIKALALLHKVEEILLTGLNDNANGLNEIVEICQDAGLRYRLFSPLNDIDSTRMEAFPVRDLELADIFPRQKIHVDHAAVKNILTGKTVLVYGSGGALGAELCQQILQLGCRKLIIVDRYEAYLNELAVSLFNVFSQDLIIPVLTDTERIDTLKEVFRNYQPAIIFDASMRKYMPFLLLDADDVMKANYTRTFDVAKLASKFSCEHFVMISSLMVHQRSDLITDSLRVAEVSLSHFFEGSNTRLSIVRIGDIIENRGGIVSLIEEQIRKHRAVTLPSPEAHVYLMSKYSATETVLQALGRTDRSSSEENVFTFNSNLQISLDEVARRLAKFHGVKLRAGVQFKYSEKNVPRISLRGRRGSGSTLIYHPIDGVDKGYRDVSSEEVR